MNTMWNEEDEYESNSSAEEEEYGEEVNEHEPEMATLDRKANFLLRRVSTFGRTERFNSRLML